MFVRFLQFFSTEFAACSKHQAEKIIVKRLIQEGNNVELKSRAELNPDHAISVVVKTMPCLLSRPRSQQISVVYIVCCSNVIPTRVTSRKAIFFLSLAVRIVTRYFYCV